jgi:lipid-binding SYLF domain-containing protein
MKRSIAILFVMLLGACSSGSPVKSGSTLDESQKATKRQAVLAMRDATLERLYREKPEAKESVARGAGYAVFDGTGVNVILYVGGKGSGVLVDAASGKNTFMSMMKAGTGPGLGYKEFKQVIVFKTPKAMSLFLSTGIDIGAAFDFGDKASGGSFNPDFDLYTITEKGFTVQANWGGTKYFRDDQLN